jgi:hypothetical protein
MEVCEHHALLCERIEVRGSDLAAVRTEVRPTEVVGNDEQDVGSLDIGYVVARRRRCASADYK